MRRVGADGSVSETADVSAPEEAMPVETELDAYEGPSWRQDTSPFEVDWFVSWDWFGEVFDPVNNETYKKILNETGATINFSSGDYEKFNTLIATDSLPDVVTSDISGGLASLKLLKSNQMLLPLDELMEKYAPDLQYPQLMMDWYRYTDGHWYEIVNYTDGEGRWGHNANFVRTDLLAEIGMTMDDLHTKNGFMDALKRVKEMGLKYDDALVTPFLGAYEHNFAEQFGMQREDKDGNLINSLRTPEYLEALLYLNEMFRNGLFTDEEFTMDGTQRQTKIASGQVFLMNGWNDVYYGRLPLYNADPDATILFNGVITDGGSGNPPLMASVGPEGWGSTVIMKNARHPDRIIRLFAYLTTDEAMVDAMYGANTYTFQEDGRMVRKPEVEAEFNENYQAAYAKYQTGFDIFVQWAVIEDHFPVASDTLDIDERFFEDELLPMIYNSLAMCNIAPQPETESELWGVNDQIWQYWSQARPKIIMAGSADECKTLFEQALAEMDGIGMARVDEYQNKIFKENKQRLNIDFITHIY